MFCHKTCVGLMKFLPFGTVSSSQFKFPFNIMWFMASSIQTYTHKLKWHSSDFFLNPARDGQYSKKKKKMYLAPCAHYKSHYKLAVWFVWQVLLSLPRPLTWPHCSYRLLDCVKTLGLVLTLIERERVTWQFLLSTESVITPQGYNYTRGEEKSGKKRRYKKKERAAGCGQQKQPQILI